MDQLSLDEKYKTYSLGDFKLKSGDIIEDAHLAYKQIGDASNPAIIYLTWYSGSISDNLWLIGSDKMLNPSKYHIIIPALFGNSESSSPSNTNINPFPHVTFYDNVRAQHQLLTEGLGIKHAHAVLGWSMGAGQSFQWATQYPDFMDRVVPFCGSARTSLHNRVFLESIKSALLAVKGIPSAGVNADGVTRKRTWSDTEKEVGLKALARVYAGWGFSQTFYRQELFKTAPAFKGMFEDLEDFMTKFWIGWACSKDPENMLTMLWTWQSGDVSAQEPYNGDFSQAMKGIKAKTLILPCRTDLYFPPEDSEIELENMNEGVGRLEVFPSVWGHWAGGPGQSLEDVKWLDDKLKDFLA